MPLTRVFFLKFLTEEGNKMVRIPSGTVYITLSNELKAA